MRLPLLATLVASLLGSGAYVFKEPLFGAPTLTIANVKALQDAYFAKEGKYLHILEGGRLADYESGTIRQKLGRDIPTNFELIPYNGPLGAGFQVCERRTTELECIGFGPEALSKTITYQIPDMSVATTTP